MVEKKLRIVYIAGSGRSGSTLLARILGQLEGVSSIGEMRHIWRTGAPKLSTNELCGCGARYRDCELWPGVLETVFGRGENIPVSEISALKDKVDRVRYIPWMLSSFAPRDFKRRLEAYSDLMRRIYSSIQRRTSCRVIVDTSKDPSTLFLLAKMDDIETTVVHLVRDVRGVVFSWKKTKQVRPEFPDQEVFMRRYGVLKTSGRWNYGNFLTELSGNRHKSYIFIRYEDFVNDPSYWTGGICRMAGIEEPDLSFIAPGHVLLSKKNHTLSGNPSRFQEGRVPLRLDQEWKSAMRRSDRLAATIVSLPFLWRYGYLTGRL